MQEGFADMKRVSKMICLLLILTVMTAGCQQKKQKRPAADDGAYKIYNINSDQDGLTYKKHKTQTKQQDALIEELLKRMSADPDSFSYKKAINDNIIIKERSITDGCLKINFDSAYQNQDSITEALMRAAIVKTLSQVEGVEYVEFYVNGVPLTDASDNAYGQMKAEDFIDSQDVNTSHMTAVLNLYFSNVDGTKLVECTEKKWYDGSITIEQLIILRLIEGPDELEQKQGMKAIMPADTVLNNVTTKEGVCYVDFNKGFLTQMDDVKAEVTLYAVVNSLVEISSINKVQIMIDGKIVDSSLDNVPLNKIYDRSLDWVEGSK